MARTREQVISEMVDSGLFSDEEIKAAARKSEPIATEGAQKKEGTLSSINNAALKTVKTGFDILNAPFEVVGEAGRGVAEMNNNPDGFRAPSIVQDILPSMRTAEPPMNPFSLVNKLLRAGAGAVSGIPGGTPLESARAAYNAPRGGLGVAEDTAMGLLLGKVAPETLAAPIDTTIEGATSAAGGLKNAASTVAKKGIRAALGPSEEAQSILASRPQDVARQTDFAGLGDKLAESVNGLSQKVGELDNNAWDKLLKLKAEPQSKLISILKDVKQDFIGTGKTKIGNADRAAAAQIDDYIQRVKDIKQPGATPGTEQFLDQPQLKNIIQSIRKDANYSLPESDPVNMAVKEAGAKIDAYLKDQNLGYADAMKPVADATAALKDAVKQFRLEHKTNEGFLPTKTTISKLTASVKGKSPEIDRILEQLKSTTGVDFADEAKLTAVKQEFAPGVQRTAGSRRAVAGGAMGAGAGAMASKALGLPPSVGAAVGGAAGTAAGGAADYYGGAMAQKVIELLGGANNGMGNLLKQVTTRASGTPLQDVIQRIINGEPALAPLLRKQ